MNRYGAFAEQDLKCFEPEAKIGLLATLTPEGLPHVTLITTMTALTTTKLVWGQFSYGLSKLHVKTRPETGFLVLTPDRKLWRGKARYVEARTEGDEYEMLNRKPMFRYNTYFGINTAHYMDLVETFGRESLPLPGIVAATLATQWGRSAAVNPVAQTVFNPWTAKLLDAPATLKFLAFKDADGFPKIVPLLQCRTAGSDRLAFSSLAYSRELHDLKEGMPAAVFALNLQMESVLVRGQFRGFARRRLVEMGVVDVDYVYNSMPPNHGQIFPPQALEAVREF